MKAIIFDDFGGPDVLRLAEVPYPELRPTDILVKVMASGVNRADLLQREGHYGSRAFGDSPILGLEVAGGVIAVGGAVSKFSVGDLAMSIVGGGAYAEVARADSGLSVHIPGAMSYVEAAAVMESFVTAYEALCHLGQIRPQEIVLVHAAAGGIGSAVVQLAVAMGARVFATASDSNIDKVRSLGAEAVWDYHRQDFEAEIIDATGSCGADLIIDFVGGNYLARNIRSLAEGGRLVQVGLLGRDDSAIIPLDTVLYKHLRVIGTVMKSRVIEEKRAMVRRFAENALPMFGDGRLRPLVGEVFPLDRAADAHRRMEAGGGFGKVVLEAG
ncbi:NAD(P)H-quinone oxidoreductase [Rhizobium sp. 11515TR]|uniref:NAD(P)H-quinone oxidoreductase n=1 Tax=Rhizobium sp. 11515TR TaxID=2028343 RepID=UPI000BA89757|nr:NAD(P)H-quinone oxidoreductase [Rhizobium sp. 11515TR]ASW04763.1 quinone oxidoreductase [Rhizobium sp. 11515TR]